LKMVAAESVTCFQFIDLAGSEKSEKQEMKSIGSQECKKINNSLFVLRKVITVMAYNNTIIDKDKVKEKSKIKDDSKSKLKVAKLVPPKSYKALLIDRLPSDKKDKQNRIIP